MQHALDDGKASPPIIRHEDGGKERLIVDDINQQRLLNRSPHPYHRKRIFESTTRVRPDLAARSRTQDLTLALENGGKRGSIGSQDGDRLARRASKDAIASPSESGTEADDEAYASARALPAPPLRPRKGLKVPISRFTDGEITPLLTPTRIDEDATKFEFMVGKTGDADRASTDEEMRVARAKFVKRRRAELARRASETILLGLIALTILSNTNVGAALGAWQRVELMSYISIIAVLYLLYPMRLVLYAWGRTRERKSMPQTIRLPAAFDPASLLYPVFVPAMVALILLPSYPKALLPSLVLGLSSVPGGLYRFGNWDVEQVRWLVSLVPLFMSEHTDIPRKIPSVTPYKLKLAPAAGLNPELIALLYPLHHSLVDLLHYLTTTSLLPAEVHLMSIGLIHLLLCAELPHTVILQVLLWLGGLSLFVFTGPVIRWNIALARVPRWRLRKAGRIAQMRQSFISTLRAAVVKKQPVHERSKASDGDDSEGETGATHQKLTLEGIKQTLKKDVFAPLKQTISNTITDGNCDRSTVDETLRGFDGLRTEESNGSTKMTTRSRRNTLPNLGGRSSLAVPSSEERPLRRQRTSGHGKTLLGRPFLLLTREEALVRKWIYALYVYAVMVLMVLGPVRNWIRRYALNTHEPFGWAIGYLGGNIQRLRFWTWQWNLEEWIALPALQDSDISLVLSRLEGAERYRHYVIGEATTRLLLCGWCLTILAVGLLIVLSFTFVEVDTRRKVFHGMMVAMLLPTVPIDPAFISLALVLILAIFLILDFLRASQLPPLSRPLASFLTPYVDGRDLRGPVVVSHIFLLIGCAIPLWLSLAGMKFEGEEPWVDWSVQGRDVSMVAGVVCVGMGDAAASLIGRRYGRRKWPWTGGKSLEGSAAFALAVTVGLSATKLWLWLGRWDDLGAGAKQGLTMLIAKTSIAACGASFMEAVLTGGNDNVVVPVILWLLVKALDI